MNERVYKIIRNTILGVIVLGVGMLVYPHFAELWNQYFTSRAMSNYNNKVAAMSPEEIAASFKKAKDFNKRIRNEPNRFRLPGVLGEMYEDTLDVSGTGIIGIVHVPKLNIHVPIYHGNSDSVLQIGAGHMKGTSFPIGDKGSHGVVAAHTGMASAKLFTGLTTMKKGDDFYITILNRDFCYKVSRVDVTLPDNTDLLEIPELDSYCTLLTCTPIGVNSHRLLVRGIFTGERESTLSSEIGNMDALNSLRILFCGIVLTVICLCLVVWLKRYKRRKKR